MLEIRVAPDQKQTVSATAERAELALSIGVRPTILRAASREEKGLVAAPADEQIRMLMLGFCSIGENCEFGQAQRDFGAEPIDLLRWGSTPRLWLLKLLRAKFEGVGDIDKIKVYAIGGVFKAMSTLYQFNWHAWERVGATTSDAILQKESQRVTYLARKLASDLAEADRIFVVSDPLNGMVFDDAIEILAAMQAFGTPTLMYVTQGAPPSVTRQGQYLIHATVPHFADPSNVSKGTPSDDWLAVCQMARALV